MEAEKATRRLAAVLAADVVGYSRLIEADEEGTIARLRALRTELLGPEIAGRGGRIVKTAGDGLLVEFASVVDAVACAVRIQRQVAAREVGAGERERLSYRMGVNLGDIVVDGDDILGDGVNIAARLEGLADPGGICLSDDVYRQVRGKLDCGFEDLGERTMKNLATPLRVYRVRGEGGAALPGAPAAPALRLPDKPSIAVLPFETMGDATREFFADGLSEDIITELSRFRDLFVIARNSSFGYKGRHAKVQAIAADLGVRYLLEGRVQWAGDSVRITAQLIDAPSGEHVWAERYDRNVSDVFSVRDEVTADIVAHLGGYHGELVKAEKRRSRRADTTNLKAFEGYLLGIELKHKFTPDNNFKAREVLGKVIALDPEYARAYTALAWTWLFDVWWGWSQDPMASFARAVELARKAAELDDLDAEVHWLLGELANIERNFEKLEAEYQRALTLNPNLADIHANRGASLNHMGRAGDGVEEIRRAIRLNPNYPEWYTQFLGAALYGAREYEEAVATLRRVKGHNYMSRLYLAASHARMERAEEARAELAEALKLNPIATVAGASAAEYYREAADRQHFEDGLRMAGLPE